MGFHWNWNKVLLLKISLPLILLLVPLVSSQFGFENSNYLYNPYAYPPRQSEQGPIPNPYAYPPNQQVPRQPQPVAPVPVAAAGSGPERVRAGYSTKNGSYVLEWEVTGPSITFKATRRGTGFVGFAISPTGGMAGADIFIAGIDVNGMPFANVSTRNLDHKFSRVLIMFRYKY